MNAEEQVLSQDVSEWVVDWFVSRGKIRCSRQEALATDYLQSGSVTSLEIVQLVSEVEGRFNMQFSEEEMQDPRFSTIGGLAELINAALNRIPATQS